MTDADPRLGGYDGRRPPSAVRTGSRVPPSGAPMPRSGVPVRRTSPPTPKAPAGWRKHSDLLGNAFSLAATTGVTAGLGFVYWAVAARLFSVKAVGYGSAAVSAMTMLGIIGMFGLGTLLIGELPRRSSRASLVSAALLVSGLGSLALGIGFSVIAPLVSGRFEELGGTVLRGGLFVFGVAVTAVTLVFDQATIGLLRGGLQLTRNIAFSVAKLAALPATALLLHDELGVGIILSWVAGTAVSLIPIMFRLLWTRSDMFARPALGELKSLGRTTIAHNWLNLSLAVRQNSIPILVTLVISPAANAVFYAAWMITSFLLIVPAHLSTVLFAVTSADEQVVALKLRFTLRLSFLIGLPGMALMVLCAHPLLALFGARYASEATVPLILLVIGYIPAVPKAHYIAVARVRGKMARAAGVMTLAAAMEVIAAVAGGLTGGLRGLSVALLAVRIVEGLVTTPTVISATVARGRHRRPVAGESAIQARPAMDKQERQLAGLAALRAMSVTEKRERQHAGLAVMMALSTGTAPTMFMPRITAEVPQESRYALAE